MLCREYLIIWLCGIMEFNIVNFRINLPLDGKERAVRSAASVDVKPARMPDVKHTVKQDSKPEPKVKPEEKKSPPKPKESQIKVEPATPKQLSPKKVYFPHLIIIIMKNTIFFYADILFRIPPSRLQHRKHPLPRFSPNLRLIKPLLLR